MTHRRVAALLLIAGALLASLSVGLLARNVIPAFSNATQASTYQTPVDVVLPLDAGDYVLWVADAGSGTASVFGEDFKISDDAGHALPFRAITTSEVLSRSDGQYVGELSFTVPRSGNYTVAIRSDVATRVIVSQDFFRRLVANLWWFGGAGVGLITFIVGAVLLIVAARNARRRREHDAFVAAYGYPPGYGPPPMASYGPSAYGAPPAYPGAPHYPGPYAGNAYAYPPSELTPSSSPTTAYPAAVGPPALPYPGWYPDPEDRSRYRWWSGTSWEASYASETDISGH